MGVALPAASLACALVALASTAAVFGPAHERLGEGLERPPPPTGRPRQLAARRGVDAMEAGRRTAIPGLVNQLFAAGGRYLPRTVTLPLAYAASKLSLD